MNASQFCLMPKYFVPWIGIFTKTMGNRLQGRHAFRAVLRAQGKRRGVGLGDLDPGHVG